MPNTPTWLVDIQEALSSVAPENGESIRKNIDAIWGATDPQGEGFQTAIAGLLTNLGIRNPDPVEEIIEEKTQPEQDLDDDAPFETIDDNESVDVDGLVDAFASLSDELATELIEESSPVELSGSTYYIVNEGSPVWVEVGPLPTPELIDADEPNVLTEIEDALLETLSEAEALFVELSAGGVNHNWDMDRIGDIFQTLENTVLANVAARSIPSRFRLFGE